MNQTVNTVMREAKEFYTFNDGHLIYSISLLKQEMASMKLIRRIIINSLNEGIDYEDCIKANYIHMVNGYSSEFKPTENMYKIFASAVLSQKTNGCRSLGTIEEDTLNFYKSKEHLSDNFQLAEIISMLGKLSYSKQVYAVAEYALKAYIENYKFSDIQEFEKLNFFKQKGESTYDYEIFKRHIKTNEFTYKIIEIMVKLDVINFIAVLELLNRKYDALYSEEKKKDFSDENHLFSKDIKSFDSLLEGMAERCGTFCHHNNSKPDLNFIDDMIKKLELFKSEHSKQGNKQQEKNTVSSDPLA